MIDRRTLLVAGAAMGALTAATKFGNAEAATETNSDVKVAAMTDTAAAQPVTDYLKISEADWRKRLTPQQFAILRKHGTERPGSSPLNSEHRKGTFACAGCDLPLFASDTKFESGTGWPSFYAPLPNAVATTTDRSFFMARTEVHCRRCIGHLGHVFDDGPKPTGLRYCMNAISLKYEPAAASSS
jgi:peptide-methionine (R)-S-oxide reductase